MSSLLTRLFPTPRLLAMEGGGIEISDRSVKFMRFVAGPQGSVRVRSFGELPLPVGAIVGGEIVDKEALVSMLRDVRTHCGFSLCAVSLPENQGYLFSDRLPRSAMSDLPAALASTLADHVPFSSAEAVCDYTVIENESTAEHVAVVGAAVSRELAIGYEDALCQAGFLPLSLELESQAAARAIAARHTSNRAIIITDVGETKNLLCVVQDGMPRLTTSGEGSRTLDEELIESGLDHAEIIRRKTDLGVAYGATPETRMFVELADRVANEISRLAAQWNARATMKGHASIGEAVIYGGNANMKGLPHYLSRQAGFPVTVSSMWENAGSGNSVPPIALDQSQRFATVAGLAMRAVRLKNHHQLKL